MPPNPSRNVLSLPDERSVMSQNGITGRNVVVTGGGTGIGRSVASAFAASGDHITIVGRRRDVLRATAEDLRTEHGCKVTAVACDLADPDDVEAVLDRLPRRIDVLVNNAGSRELTMGVGPHAVLA